MEKYGQKFQEKLCQSNSSLPNVKLVYQQQHKLEVS